MDAQKEFFEHLRLVHFALIVTALVLLVGSSLRPSYLYESAYRQAHDVRKFTKPLSVWAHRTEIPDLWDQIAAVNAKTPLYLVADQKVYDLLRPYGWRTVSNESKHFLEHKDMFNPF